VKALVYLWCGEWGLNSTAFIACDVLL